MLTIDFPHERWFSPERFDGYGSIAIVRQGGTDCLALKPMTARSADETHAALVTSALAYGDFDATFADVVTLEHLRESDAPNPWERAWLLWHFIDVHHFYYFVLKSKGWELGKLDPAYLGGQRFLATGESPGFPIGVSNTVRVRQHRGAIRVDVDDERITTFVDAGDSSVSRACGVYPFGRFGFYCEDAHVRFGGFSVFSENR
jgi:hypothetical protein